MTDTFIPIRDMQQAIVASGLALPRFGIDGKCGGETLTAARQMLASVFGSSVTVSCGTGGLSWAVVVSGTSTAMNGLSDVIAGLAATYNPAVHGTGRRTDTARPAPRPPEAGGTEPVVSPIDDSAPVSPTGDRPVSWVPLALVGVGVVGLVAYMAWGK